MNLRIEHLANSLICPVSDAPNPARLPEGIDPDLVALLSCCNGGYTAGFLFHIFGTSGPVEHDIIAWNTPDLWKAEFGLDDRCFVFAENILGMQYYLHQTQRRRVVRTFNPEDGTSVFCASSFDQFITTVLGNEENIRLNSELRDRFNAHEGVTYPVFHHLSSKIPSCLGGVEEDLDNMEYSRSTDNLKFLGQVLSQVKLLPEGAVVREVRYDEATQSIRLIT
jgi:hypothetical protein